MTESVSPESHRVSFLGRENLKYPIGNFFAFIFPHEGEYQRVLRYFNTDELLKRDPRFSVSKPGRLDFSYEGRTLWIEFANQSKPYHFCVRGYPRKTIETAVETLANLTQADIQEVNNELVIPEPNSLPSY